jgi:hypothetical protein
MQPETLVALGGVVRDLNDLAVAVRRDTDEVVKTNNHVDIIKHFNHLRIAMGSVKDAREALKQIEETLSREIIPDVMRSNEIKTTTIEDVGRVTVSYRFSCTMLDKEHGIDWLKGNGHESLVQETVNSSTLSAFAKNMLEEHGKELPPEIFKVGTSPYTSITKR